MRAWRGYHGWRPHGSANSLKHIRAHAVRRGVPATAQRPGAMAAIAPAVQEFRVSAGETHGAALGRGAAFFEGLSWGDTVGGSAAVGRHSCAPWLPQPGALALGKRVTTGAQGVGVKKTGLSAPKGQGPSKGHFGEWGGWVHSARENGGRAERGTHQLSVRHAHCGIRIRRGVGGSARMLEAGPVHPARMAPKLWGRWPPV